MSLPQAISLRCYYLANKQPVLGKLSEVALVYV